MARARAVAFVGDEMFVALDCGAVLQFQVERFPRLWVASKSQRANYRLIGNGVGIHWPDIDEDLSVDGLVRDSA